MAPGARAAFSRECHADRKPRVAIGTAVRPLRDDDVIERPTMVLSLDA
jgi:hypothetical protein